MDKSTKELICYIARYNTNKLSKFKKAIIQIEEDNIEIKSERETILNMKASELSIGEGARLPVYFSQITLRSKQGDVWHILPYSPFKNYFMSNILLQSKFTIPARNKIAQALKDSGITESK